MTRQPMNTLPAGTRFVGLDGRTEYVVTTPASAHPEGWVRVRAVSVTDTVVPGCDPRDDFFSTGQAATDVEVLP